MTIKLDKKEGSNTTKTAVENNQPQKMLKEEAKPESRKLFQNKKANIAIGVVFAVLVLLVGYIALF